MLFLQVVPVVSKTYRQVTFYADQSHNDALAEGSPDGASSSKKAKRGSKENSDGVREGVLNLA